LIYPLGKRMARLINCVPDFRVALIGGVGTLISSFSNYPSSLHYYGAAV
jgi:hypothetical protein